MQVKICFHFQSQILIKTVLYQHMHTAHIVTNGNLLNTTCKQRLCFTRAVHNHNHILQNANLLHHLQQILNK